MDGCGRPPKSKSKLSRRPEEADREAKRRKGVAFWLSGAAEAEAEERSNSARPAPLEPISDASRRAASGGASTSSSEGRAPGGTPAAPRLPAPPAGCGGAAAGHHVGSSLLQSLQRRFCSQQALATPAAPAAAPAGGPAAPAAAEPAPPSAEEDDDLQGFCLFSQPAYERVLSQCPPEAEAHDDDADGEGGGGRGYAASPLDDEAASQPPAPPPAATDSGGGGALTLRGGGGAGHTPAVHSADRVQLNARSAGRGAAPALFPVFRSRRDLKVLYVVRHGESEYNAATAKRASGFADPLIFDAPLTALGRAQAAALRAEVAAWGLPADALWVSSPLSRALETMLLACPFASALGRPGGPAAAVLPDIAEKVFTSGDVGRPPAELAVRFPALAPLLAPLPERWWYERAGRPNCATARAFGAAEPAPELARRVAAFRRWALARPERVIVAFGHSVFWRDFAAACRGGVRGEALKNCGFLRLHI
jgi:broad specificity phosphatase PhoE